MSAPKHPAQIPGFGYYPHSDKNRLEAEGFHRHGKSWYRCRDVDITPNGYRAEWEVMFSTRQGLAKRVNVYTHPTICHDPMKEFGEQPNMGPASESYFVDAKTGKQTPAGHRNAVRRRA